MSATLPASEFSKGIIILYESSSNAVLKVSSNVEQVFTSASLNKLLQAI